MTTSHEEPVTTLTREVGIERTRLGSSQRGFLGAASMSTFSGNAARYVPLFTSTPIFYCRLNLNLAHISPTPHETRAFSTPQNTYFRANRDRKNSERCATSADWGVGFVRSSLPRLFRADIGKSDAGEWIEKKHKMRPFLTYLVCSFVLQYIATRTRSLSFYGEPLFFVQAQLDIRYRCAHPEEGILACPQYI